MRRLARAVIVLVLIVSPHLALAQPVPRIDALRVAFEGWMKEYGIDKAVLVARTRDGADTLEHGYGGQDARQRVLLASLSKAITGQCVAGLIAVGRLRFDSTVAELLRPFFATHGEPADPRIRQASVAQLLEHRAGFAAAPRDLMTPAAMELLQKRRSPATASLQELLAAALTVPLQSAPGEAFRYSNVGYLVLGAIVEVVTGEDYERFCARTVLQPVGIEDGGLDPDWRSFSAFGGWRLSGAEYLRAMASRRFPACRESLVSGRDPAPALVTDWNEQERCERPMLGTMPPGPDDLAPFHWLGRNAALVRREVNVTSDEALHLRRWYRYWHTGSWGVGPNTIGMLAVEHESGLSWFVWFTPRPPQAARDRLFEALLEAAKDG
ncbi:MAG: serine hydrolase [Alphaproteobacteria bacterium]|nr:serine hydrolase [Alphaproteobacteria bacterium]MCW5741218.1 serine hydrolase [Alphaproteobacteria bacterium]